LLAVSYDSGSKSVRESESHQIEIQIDTEGARSIGGELRDTVTEGVEKRDITRRNEGIEDERSVPRRAVCSREVLMGHMEQKVKAGPGWA
jgi:citrate lyase gamma subunit